MLHTVDSTGPGKTVLVHSAAGGVGLVAVQLAKVAGARVFGTVSSDAKIPLVKEHGADAVINYTTAEVRRRGAEADRRRRRRPDPRRGRQADVRGRAALPRAFGHLILYGRAGGPTDPLNVATLSAKSHEGQRLHGADGHAQLPREDARERRALLRADARGPAASSTSARRSRSRRPPTRTATSSRGSRRASWSCSREVRRLPPGAGGRRADARRALHRDVRADRASPKSSASTSRGWRSCTSAARSRCWRTRS